MTVQPELLKRLPMLDGLQDSERAEIAVWCKEASVAQGSFLYREGEPAADACFLLDGELEVMRALPGGGEARLTTITPGAMIGEMALVAGGTRTASVRALKPSSVLIVSRYFFDAALDQMSVPAFKVLRALARRLAERRNRLRQQTLQELNCHDHATPADVEPAGDDGHSDRAGATAATPSFDYRAFLPILPGFEALTAVETDHLVQLTSVRELARDAFLYREQAPATACYIVVRGALEVSVVRDCRHQLAILGPGRFAGANALILESAQMSDVRLRSDSLLLALGQGRVPQPLSRRDDAGHEVPADGDVGAAAGPARRRQPPDDAGQS